MGIVRTIRGAAIAALTLAVAWPAWAAEPEPTSLDASEVESYLGKWDVKFEFNGNPVDMTVNLIEMDGKAAGTVSNPFQGELAFTDIEVKDDGVALHYPAEFGGNQLQMTLFIKQDDEKQLTGTLSEANGLFSSDITGAPAADKAPVEIDYEPTELDASEAEDFLGDWTMSMEMQGNKVQMVLHVVEREGKLAAAVENAFTDEPALISEAAKTDEGLEMKFPLGFGGTSFEMTLTAKKEGEKLLGSIREKSGLFEAEFTAEPGAVQLAGDGDGGRRRRGGGGSTKIEVGDKQEVRITFGDLKAEGEDYPKLAQVKEGEVFKFVGSRATKLFTDVDLKFGDTVVETENVAENYPGVYGLWLRKTADGWNLVFNEQPDIWGTQHDPEFDVAEVPLEYSEADEAAEAMKVDLSKPEDGSEGELKIAFGEHVWTAKFAPGS